MKTRATRKGTTTSTEIEDDGVIQCSWSNVIFSLCVLSVTYYFGVRHWQLIWSSAKVFLSLPADVLRWVLWTVCVPAKKVSTSIVIIKNYRPVVMAVNVGSCDRIVFGSNLWQCCVSGQSQFGGRYLCADWRVQFSHLTCCEHIVFHSCWVRANRSLESVRLKQCPFWCIDEDNSLKHTMNCTNWRQCTLFTWTVTEDTLQLYNVT